MKFEQALEAMRQGKCVKRKSKYRIYCIRDAEIAAYQRIGTHNGNPVIGDDQPFLFDELDAENILAEDWVTSTLDELLREE